MSFQTGTTNSAKIASAKTNTRRRLLYDEEVIEACFLRTGTITRLIRGLRFFVSGREFEELFL